MIKVMMIIGSYPFMIDTATYDALKRTSAWKWKSQARTGRKPAQHYTGAEADKIVISGMILPEFKGGYNQIALMKGEANKRKPLQLVDGQGYVWGDYVITAISESQSFFQANGRPKRQDFTMNLLEYNDDGANTTLILNEATLNAARSLL